MAALYGLTSAGVQAYRAAMPGSTPGEIYSAIQTDWYWRIPAVGFADAHAASARAATHMYEFAWPSPQGGGRLGAAHCCEMAFVFDTLGLGTEAMLGPNPPQALADAMHGAWVQFAKTGDCGWPAYKPDRRLTMRFDEVSKVVEDRWLLGWTFGANSPNIDGYTVWCGEVSISTIIATAPAILPLASRTGIAATRVATW